MAYTRKLYADTLGGTRFKTADGEVHKIDGTWDLIIAHPPCTYLTVTGNRWFKDECLNAAQARYLDRAEAIEFFLRIAICNAKKLAIENPVGIMSSVYRKPDQIIEPYWFGERARKKTCLWLRNLPPLVPTDMVDCGEISKEGLSMGAGAYHAIDDTGKIIAWNDPMTAIIRSRTYPGIAKAMAEQWG